MLVGSKVVENVVGCSMGGRRNGRDSGRKEESLVEGGKVISGQSTRGLVLDHPAAH
jgi:hypothetical protein